MSDADVEIANAEAAPPAPPVVTPPKIRHDWYQTETEVIITILAKNVDPQKVKVDITVTSLSVTAPLPCGTDYSLKLNLALPVIPSRSSHKISASKSESGGTVLSTNWNEVASSKVSIKPPDGQEFKKWE
ncbi:hypothetical protein B566_EDAN004990 [Ephemera danica]|nr:hypothetical protein B566_EDAN004990 [Ephemera danica]